MDNLYKLQWIENENSKFECTKCPCYIEVETKDSRSYRKNYIKVCAKHDVFGWDKISKIECEYHKCINLDKKYAPKYFIDIREYNNSMDILKIREIIRPDRTYVDWINYHDCIYYAFLPKNDKYLREKILQVSYNIYNVLIEDTEIEYYYVVSKDMDEIERKVREYIGR